MLEQNYVYSNLVVPIQSDDHMIGDESAPIKLVEYGDYECPFCGRAYQQMKRLLSEAGDNVCYVFRNFPLTQIHPHAENAAEASEIAAQFGKYWEMHGMLFENQDALDDQSLVQYAHELRIPTQRFMHELRTHSMAPKVRADFMGGVRSGVSGTPTFFVNDVRFNGSSDDLVEALLTELENG
jgi:protein-disulfide isomerase